MTTSRQYNLLKELALLSEFHPVQHFADLFQVSARTIHNDLKVIDELTDKFNCEILKVPRKGILLAGSVKDKSRLIEYMQDPSTIQQLSPFERQIEILERLINEEYISYNALSKEYLVSRSSIASDFKVISQICSNENTDLAYDNNGTYLIGNEKQLQKLLQKLNLMKFELTFNRFPNNIIEFKQFLSTLENGFYDGFVEETFNIIYKIGERYRLADHYLINLQNMLLVLCIRARNGYHQKEEYNYMFEKIKELETYFIANEIAETISKNLDLDFTKQDIIYLSSNLLAYGIENFNLTNNEGYFSDITKELVEQFSKILNIDLTADTDLQKGLLNHIVPMIYRLNNDIIIKNPLIQEIKKQYSVMFNITWFILVELESQLNIRIPEDEIGFIMVHFQSALERNTVVKKILLVCPIGIVTSELLKTRIEKMLPSINVYEVISSNQIEHYDLEKVDFIISTVPLRFEANHIYSNKVFYISPIPADHELKNIQNYVTKELSTEKKTHEVHFYKNRESIFHYLDQDSIITDRSFTSMEEILHHLIDQLELKEIVKKEYRNSVIERESTSSTSFHTGVAIPHGNPEFVQETKIQILVNNQKVAWGPNKIDVVILLSIAKKDIKNVNFIISTIYDVISNRDSVQKVFIEKSKTDILNQLIQNSIEK